MLTLPLRAPTSLGFRPFHRLLFYAVPCQMGITPPFCYLYLIFFSVILAYYKKSSIFAPTKTTNIKTKYSYYVLDT
jgi:hypothetical protein